MQAIHQRMYVRRHCAQPLTILSHFTLRSPAHRATVDRAIPHACHPANRASSMYGDSNHVASAQGKMCQIPGVAAASKSSGKPEKQPWGAVRVYASITPHTKMPLKNCFRGRKSSLILTVGVLCRLSAACAARCCELVAPLGWPEPPGSGQLGTGKRFVTRVVHYTDNREEHTAYSLHSTRYETADRGCNASDGCSMSSGQHCWYSRHTGKQTHVWDSKQQNGWSAYMYPLNGWMGTWHSLYKRITCWDKQYAYQATGSMMKATNNAGQCQR